MIITRDELQRLLIELKKRKASYVAIDQGQCDEYLDDLKHPPIKYPAILISPQGEERIDSEKGGNKWRASITLRLYYNLPRIASQAAPESHLNEYARYLLLLEEAMTATRECGWQVDAYRRGVQIESLLETRIELSKEEWCED